MPPSHQQSVPACRSVLDLETTSPTLTDSDERRDCELQASIVVICVFGILICLAFFIIIWGMASNSESGRARRLARCCSSKARNAFTKMKSLVKRREEIPDDISDAATVATGTLTPGHGRKAARPLSDVELDDMGTPFEVPFPECTGEGKCEKNCDRGVAGHLIKSPTGPLEWEDAKIGEVGRFADGRRGVCLT
ncbi:hypothetical protein V8C34DRAFT_297095 [Trichoderma compactum]